MNMTTTTTTTQTHTGTVGNWHNDHVTTVRINGDIMTRRQLNNALTRMSAPAGTKLRHSGVAGELDLNSFSPCSEEWR